MGAVVQALLALVTLRYDALGYAPGTRVWAVLLGETNARSFRVGEARGVLGPPERVRSLAGTWLSARRIELGALPEGNHEVVLDDGTRLPPLRVARSPHRAAISAVARFLRAQRCGATCHRGDGVSVADGYDGDVSAASGPFVPAAGGWHDAGDYMKFLGTTAFVLAVELTALRDHPALGELRDELRWGTDWLLAMTTSLHHQVSGARDHDGGFRLPDEPVPGYAQRPVFRLAPQRGANLLGRSAAALATAAQVFPEDRERLVAAARRAFAEARRRPLPQEPDPPEFYGERSTSDELALGAAALARATGEKTYRDQALALARTLDTRPGTPLSWGSVDALALVETAELFPAGSPERAELARRLLRLAAPIAATDAQARGPGAVFRYALPRFGNGSIAESLGAAATCLAARRLGGDPACAEVARSQLHWLWGQNPFGLSFQIGVGDAFPKNPHHALAQATHRQLDGAIVGGPTALRELRRPGAFARFSTKDLFYEDDAENWIVNEPAIDFTAPLVFVLGELSE